MSILDQARLRSEARMTEVVEAGLFADRTDETTGDPIRELVTERYSGKARIKYESLTVSDSDTTSQSVASQKPMLSVPSGSPAIFEGDEVRVISSTADELLIDRFYTVDGAPQSGQTSSHRYPLTELS